MSLLLHSSTGETFEYDGENLYHFGVKGMKWGIRRYQNPDGSLTPEGRKRYGVEFERASKNLVSAQNKLKSAKGLAKIPAQRNLNEAKINYNIEKKHSKLSKNKRYMADYENYKKRGYSDSKAKEFATTKNILTKALVGGTGVLIGAYAAKKGFKKYNSMVDRVIRSNIALKRVGDADEPIRDAFFAAYHRGDVNKYKGLYAQQRTMERAFNGIPVQQIQRTMELTRDARIASPRKARDAMNKVLQNERARIFFNNKFVANSYVGVSPRQRAKILKEINSGKISDSTYEFINRNLLGDMHEQPAVKAFYNELKKQGYSGIQDLNDMFYSGYKSRNPVIIFDRDIIGTVSDRAISSSEMDRAIGKAQVELLLRQIPQQAALESALFGGAGLGALKVQEVLTPKENERT